MIDDLAAQGALESADAPSVTTLEVPENLAGVIQGQLARVPDESRRLLEAASSAASSFGRAHWPMRWAWKSLEYTSTSAW